MQNELMPGDLGFILESLRYTKMRFEDYKYYPDEDFRRQRIAECESVIARVRALQSEESEK